MLPAKVDGRQPLLPVPFPSSVQVDLRSSWWIRDVEIPTRLVLAPMAGVSVQAFRRQGRRFGAGLVCSEMVSCAGLQHGNERTLGYLRIASDEKPLAVQIFGSEPEVMTEAARMVEDAGADLVDVNFGCPVKKVTKTGAGATLLEDPERACEIVAAVAEAVSVPLTVKMRRGLENGSRACLELGPRLVEAGAESLTLHPRSARQMYTGEADHSLTAELVQRVDVPVIASGDVTSRARAQAILATTGAAAAVVGRAGRRGSPGAPGGRAPGRRGRRRSRPTDLDLRRRLSRAPVRFGRVPGTVPGACPFWTGWRLREAFRIGSGCCPCPFRPCPGDSPWDLSVLDSATGGFVPRS